MPAFFQKPCAVLHNVYLGLCVLGAELYWLAGPDRIARRELRMLESEIRRCRDKLLREPESKNQALRLRTELHVAEAESLAARLRHDRAHGLMLEHLRSRCGIHSRSDV